MSYNDLDLAMMQVEGLFVHDAHGRLLSINEPDPGDPAPRLFLGRTLSGNIWRTRYDLPTGIVTELEHLAADEPVVSNLQEPPRHLAEYIELLQQQAPVSDIEAGPAYCLPELAPSTSALTITPENANLLQTHYPYTMSRLAELAPVVVVVVDGAAVAACFSARITPQVAEAGVHTVEAYRGRGYAAEVVRGWAAGIRAMGRLPLYSTSWENKASQAVAAKLGAVQYSVDFSVT